jgi:UDP-N-acetyl-D-glucosamine dehydrogenase
MPDYVMAKITEALNGQGKPVKGTNVLVLGIAYKKNVDDMRESPSVVLMEKLRAKGAGVAYSDPHVPVFPTLREHQFDLSSVPLSPTNVSGFDCIVVATGHDLFDWAMIRENAQLIVDTRGVYQTNGDVVCRG